MKKILFLSLILGLSVVSGCMDLNVFITPSIFYPVAIAPADNYQLGNSTNGEFSMEFISRPEWSDAVLFDNITNTNSQQVFLSGTNQIYGYYLQHLIGGSGRTVLYLHGNTMNIDRYWPRAKLLFNTGADVFIIDYRGFGKSQGEPSEAGMLADSEAALDYLTNTLGVAKSDILIYGYSLGSVPATHLAAYADMSSALGLVLEGPIGSVEIFIQDATYLPIPMEYLTAYKLDNVSAIQDVTIPYLWIHGSADMSQKWDTHGQAVYDHYGGSVKFKKIVTGAAHSKVPLVMSPDFSVYITGISNFINNPSSDPYP